MRVCILNFKVKTNSGHFCYTYNSYTKFVQHYIIYVLNDKKLNTKTWACFLQFWRIRWEEKRKNDNNVKVKLN